MNKTETIVFILFVIFILGFTYFACRPIEPKDGSKRGSLEP